MRLFPSETRDAGYGDHYEYGEDHLTTLSQGDERARRRMQALAGARHTFRGNSNCMGLRSGYQYSLAGHFRPDFNADYLLVKVKHMGSQESALGLAMNDAEQTEQGVFYKNKFLCRRTNVPYRPPRRTPVPKVPGLMVAHIDHPDRGDPRDNSHLDAYAHLDAEGRYKATLNYDEDRVQTPADHSLPLHVAQHYAGPNYGTHFPLHGGVEVLLACVNGDPDRPVILGTVPNPNHTSPVTASNVTQNIIRTFAGNEMLMEDEEGITKISLTTPGGHNETLDDGERRIIMTSAGGHMAKLDDANRKIMALTSGGHRLEMDDSNELILLKSAGAHHLILVDGEIPGVKLESTAGHFFQIVDTDQILGMRTVAGNKMLFSDVSSDDALRGITMKTIEGHSLTLLDDENTVILQTENGDGLNIWQDSNVIMLEQSGGNNIRMSGDAGIDINGVDRAVCITGETEIKLQVGSNNITIDSTGVSINGTLVTIN